jgi:hypothetical protein
MLRRNEMSILTMLGLFNLYALRINLSVAIVHMQTQYNWSNALKGERVY